MTRVCILAPNLPFRDVPHAGGRYLFELDAAARQFAEVTFIVPDTPATRHASQQVGAPEHCILVGTTPGRTIVGRVRNFVVASADGWLRRRDAGLPPIPFALALAKSPAARRALLAADIIDLQWSEMIALAGVVGRLNRRARIIDTFHDVQSQLFARNALRGPGRNWRYWQANAWLARRREAVGVRRLDETFVFSDKDRALLPGKTATILRPPLADDGVRPLPHPGGEPIVAFISFLSREENQDAATWLVSEIWPLVRSAVPDATLLLVGSGAGDPLRSAVDAAEGVQLTGFVEDLNEVYQRAWVAIVPLRYGAGVKFKSVDALAVGVPLVTTSVGLEGIEANDFVVGVADQAGALADFVVEALTRPDEARAKAHQGHAWAVRTYGRAAFVDQVRTIVGRGRVQKGGRLRRTLGRRT